jgi:hypothetical protein
MTVRELIRELKELRCLDSTVYLSRDGEGNGFGPLNDLPIECFDEHGQRQPNNPNAVCLWPASYQNYEVQHPLRMAGRGSPGSSR